MAEKTAAELQVELDAAKQRERAAAAAALPADQRALYIREQELQDRADALDRAEERIAAQAKNNMAFSLSQTTGAPLDKLQAATSIAEMHQLATTHVMSTLSDPAALRAKADQIEAITKGQQPPADSAGAAPAAAPGGAAPAPTVAQSTAPAAAAVAPAPAAAAPGSPAPAAPSHTVEAAAALKGKGSSSMAEFLAIARQDAPVSLFGTPEAAPAPAPAAAPAPAPAAAAV